MIRTFRYPLRPTRGQETVLTSWLSACHELYNAALEERRDAWRKQHISITKIDQQKELTELRAADAQWRSVPVEIARSALVRLDLAFRALFRRVSSGQTPGFPRFRSRDRYNSFAISYGKGNFRIDSDRVCLPKLGSVRFHKYRELQGKIQHVFVGRTVRGWSISFVCDLGSAPDKIQVRSTVGIDLGLEKFATFSNGERVENPRFLRVSEETLARRQRSLTRKRRGSTSHQHAKRLVNRAHEHIRNQRLDFARKLACSLFDRFDLVAYEDLQVSRMVHGDLAKSIYDAAWGVFIGAITCKTESAGKWAVPTDPRRTSQRCSSCGAVAKKSLKQREHRCSCGFVAHRDHNAALNIETLGLSVGLLTKVPTGTEPQLLPRESPL
jgi:putative transposase